MGGSTTFLVLTIISIFCGATINYAVKTADCGENKFQCENGQCIWKWGRCDGIKHCKDQSDEINCLNVTCADNQFRCASGQCIYANRVCDGSNDCFDLSDELNCTQEMCSTNEFHCPKGHCLFHHVSCDHLCNGQSVTTRTSDYACARTDGSCADGTCPRFQLLCVTGKMCEIFGDYKVGNCSVARTCGFHCDSARNCKSTNDNCHFLHQCPKKGENQTDCVMDNLSFNSSRCSFLLTPTSTINSNVKGYAPKFIHTNLKNASVSKAKGEHVELLCEAIGYPKPNITWAWDNKPTDKWPSSLKYTLSTDNTSLFIQTISRSERGRFNCTSQNAYGKVVEFVDISVAVLSTTEVKLLISTGILILIVGLSVFGWYKCTGTGTPAVQLRKKV